VQETVEFPASASFHYGNVVATLLAVEARAATIAMFSAIRGVFRFAQTKMRGIFWRISVLRIESFGNVFL
jgi:hypothetical protein